MNETKPIDTEQRPPRSARIALSISSSLLPQAASHHAHADITTAMPVDDAERANKWVVLALSGTATFMTTLDSSIVNIGLPSIARAFGVPLSGTIAWVIIGYLVVIDDGRTTTMRVEQVQALERTFVTGLRAAFIVCAVLAALGVLAALWRGRLPGERASSSRGR